MSEIPGAGYITPKVESVDPALVELVKLAETNDRIWIWVAIQGGQIFTGVLVSRSEFVRLVKHDMGFDDSVEIASEGAVLMMVGKSGPVGIANKVAKIPLESIIAWGSASRT